jgi:hypothetical protein
MHWVPENEKLFSQQIVTTLFKSDRHHHLPLFAIHTYKQFSLSMCVSPIPCAPLANHQRTCVPSSILTAGYATG